MTIETTIQVSDRMLYVKDELSPFQPCEVTKIAKCSFRVSFTGGNKAGPFRLNAWCDRDGMKIYDLLQKPRYSRNRERVVVVPDTPENRECLNEARNRLMELKEERKKNEEKKRRAYEKEVAEQLEEVKLACGCDPHPGAKGLPAIRMQETKPDGRRLYVINLPVKAEYAERKMGWETIIVCCHDVKDYDWSRIGDEEIKEVTKIEMAYMYSNGSSYSFSSISTSKYDTEEEAIWDAVRRQYHSW